MQVVHGSVSRHGYHLNSLCKYSHPWISCLGTVSISMHLKYLITRVIRMCSELHLCIETSNLSEASQMRLVSDRGGDFLFLSSSSVPPSWSPHLRGAPRLGSWITIGQTPPSWPSSIQVEDVDTPAVKQKTHWNRDLQPSTCVWALK